MNSKHVFIFKFAKYSLVGFFLAGSFFLLPAKVLSYFLTVHRPLAQSDAIIVMAGNNKGRIPAGAMLYKDGYAKRIILTNDGVFSSWSRKYMRNLYQIEWAEEYLVQLGVPRNAIIKLPYYGSSTMFDALAVRHYLYKSGLRKIIIVTSDYHTRRSFWTFKHVLKGYKSEVYIFPAKRFSQSRLGLATECVKLAYYKIKYGILNVTPEFVIIPLKGLKLDL